MTKKETKINFFNKPVCSLNSVLFLQDQFPLWNPKVAAPGGQLHLHVPSKLASLLNESHSKPEHVIEET